MFVYIVAVGTILRNILFFYDRFKRKSNNTNDLSQFTSAVSGRRIGN